MTFEHSDEGLAAPDGGLAAGDDAQPPGSPKSPTSWRSIALGIALTLAAITFLQQYALSARIADVESRLSKTGLFQAPIDLDTFIKDVQQSVVVIECKDSLGSGWVIDLGAPAADATAEAKKLDKMFPTEVITNHHVIEDCVDTPGKVRATAHGTTYDAWLYSWDAENDLALVAIKQQVPALEIARAPKPGQWVMAVGSPYGLEGSISIGNVINVDEDGVISTAPLNSGNSGGPLVNANGRVLGTNAWSLVGDAVDNQPQNWNVAIPIPYMCPTIVDCGSDEHWTWGYDL